MAAILDLCYIYLVINLIIIAFYFIMILIYYYIEQYLCSSTFARWRLRCCPWQRYVLY